MKRLYLHVMFALFLVVGLPACNDDNKRFPTDYVGFEKAAESYTYDVQNKEETINIKVMAVSKKDEERKVKLSINKSAIFGEGYNLSQSEVVILAGQKSATATIKLYPKKLIKGTYIQVLCTPLWKDAESSQLNIKLIPK